MVSLLKKSRIKTRLMCLALSCSVAILTAGCFGNSDSIVVSDTQSEALSSWVPDTEKESFEDKSTDCDATVFEETNSQTQQSSQTIGAADIIIINRIPPGHLFAPLL